MQKIALASEQLTKNASSPELVAKVVLEAVTNENPNLRYLAGKDAETWLYAKRICLMEFYKMTKQNLN